MLLFPQRPVATLKAFAASKPPACALSLSLSAHILYSAHSLLLTSPLPSRLSFLLFTLFLLPCSLICLFPLSSVCTMHINYSEAVYWFLRLIQSEQGSALMGSCCTCYRLQHTLETARGGVAGETAEEEGGCEEEIKTASRRRQTEVEIERLRYSSVSHPCRDVLLLTCSA